MGLLKKLFGGGGGFPEETAAVRAVKERLTTLETKK